MIIFSVSILTIKLLMNKIKETLINKWSDALWNALLVLMKRVPS